MSFLDHWFLSWDKSLTRWSGILEWMNPFYIDSYRKYSFCFLTFQILNIKNTLVQEPRLHCIKLFLDKDDLCDLINIVHNEFSHLALSLSLFIYFHLHYIIPFQLHTTISSSFSKHLISSEQYFCFHLSSCDNLNHRIPYPFAFSNCYSYLYVDKYI